MNEFNNNSSLDFNFKKFQFIANPWAFFGYTIIVSLGSALTFGILYPFLSGVMVRWCVRNTLYEGRNLEFVGSSSELYIKIIIFGIISIFTFGLGIIFYGYYFVKWIIENIKIS